jgi:hypothetical protein
MPPQGPLNSSSIILYGCFLINNSIRRFTCLLKDHSNGCTVLGQTPMKCSLPTDITEGVPRTHITEMVRSLVSCPSGEAPLEGCEYMYKKKREGSIKYSGLLLQVCNKSGEAKETTEYVKSKRRRRDVCMNHNDNVRGILTAGEGAACMQGT